MNAHAHDGVLLGTQPAPLRFDRWLALLATTLAGYAMLGKGYAYIGVPPLFIGEVVTAAGVGCLLTLPKWRAVLSLYPLRCLVVFMAWGAVLTAPGLSRYGMEALRDAVVWGYGAIAFATAAAILARPQRLVVLLGWYRRFAPWLVVLLPFLWLLHRRFGEVLPTWPWADATLVHLKGGDSMVHLAGVFAFWALGLAGTVPAWQLVPMALTIPLIGSSNRGGLLTMLMVIMLCVAMRPRSPVAWKLAGAALIVLALLAAFDVRLQIPEKSREISVSQLVENVASAAMSDAGNENLRGTKQWRLNWWSDIVDYTVFGEYFWTGKGFGINLADDDGYQVNDDRSLRSPHNGHMTMLARMGVPGAALWAVVIGAWAWMMLDALRLSRRRGHMGWHAALLFLFAYGAACLSNATFDVFLEGPMGGIWFWTLYGAGVAAAWIYPREPDLFGDVTGTIR